jgi:mannose-1-phosphate guanylyltransferase
MCGGEGTRLHPLTFDRPKPSIPILNRPSVEHLIEHLSSLGFRDIIITLGYMGEIIKNELGDGSVHGVKIDYVHEKEPLGTAGSVKNAEEYLDDTFIVLGGDHVLDLNLQEMVGFHAQNDGIVSIALICIEDPQEFGIADIDVENRIRRFKEKPAPGEIFSNLASTGIYVCDPEIFDFIPDGRVYDFARDLFPLLLEEQKKIYGWLARGRWTDIGSPASYRQASRWKLENMTGTRIAGEFHMGEAEINGPVNIGYGALLGSGSSIVGPAIIGEDTKLGGNVLIAPYTSIGKNCTIGSESRILSSIISDNIQIGMGSCISGAIIDNNTIIGNSCMIENGSVIGPRVVIGNDVTVHSGVRIWPGIVVKEDVSEDIINEDYGWE